MELIQISIGSDRIRVGAKILPLFGFWKILALKEQLLSVFRKWTRLAAQILIASFLNEYLLCCGLSLAPRSGHTTVITSATAIPTDTSANR